jgi:DNA-binding transcriptional LysR family regulator
VRGRLRMASPPGLGGSFVGSFLARFRRQHPQVDLELVVTERRPHLIEEQFDVVLATELPPDLPWTRRTLGRSWYIAVASPLYLRGHPALEEPEDLTKHVVLSTPWTPEGLATWPRLRGPPVAVRPAFVTNDLPTLRVAALEGLGIALLPAHLVLHDLESQALVQVLIKRVGAQLDIFALHAPERRKSPVLRAFFESLAKYTAELTAFQTGKD